jgi:hypothetical protein
LVLTFTVISEGGQRAVVTACLEAMASDPFGIDLSLELLSKLPEEPKRLTDDQSSSHLVIESSMN